VVKTVLSRKLYMRSRVTYSREDMKEFEVEEQGRRRGETDAYTSP